jgi:hypothetical protein
MKIVTNLNQPTFYSPERGCVEFPVQEIISAEELAQLSEDEQTFIQSTEYNKTLPEVPLQFWFDITSEPDVIWFKFINVALNTTVFNFKLDYNLIKNHINYADQTLWAISDNFKLDYTAHVIKNNSPYSIVKSELVPVLTNTFVSKETQINSKNLSISAVPFKIFVPYKNCPLNELIFYVAKPVLSNDHRKTPISFIGPDGSSATISSTSITEENASLLPGQPGFKAGWLDLMSNMTVQSNAGTVNVGDQIVVNVNVEEPQISTVFVEPVVGYTNKTRVALINGQGSFIVNTDDLQVGDTVRIKLGYKYFSGATEYTKLIT